MKCGPVYPNTRSDPFQVSVSTSCVGEAVFVENGFYPFMRALVKQRRTALRVLGGQLVPPVSRGTTSFIPASQSALSEPTPQQNAPLLPVMGFRVILK